MTGARGRDPGSGARRPGPRPGPGAGAGARSRGRGPVARGPEPGVGARRTHYCCAGREGRGDRTPISPRGPWTRVPGPWALGPGYHRSEDTPGKSLPAQSASLCVCVCVCVCVYHPRHPQSRCLKAPDPEPSGQGPSPGPGARACTKRMLISKISCVHATFPKPNPRRTDVGVPVPTGPVDKFPTPKRPKFIHR